MKLTKKIVSLALSLALAAVMLPTPQTTADLQKENGKTGYIELTVPVQAASTNYYSRSLPIFNITSTGISGTFTISAGSVPTGATVTKVTLKASKSGSGSAYWCVRHEESGKEAEKSFLNTTYFSTEFTGLTAKSSWTVWAEGNSWTTLKAATIRIDYKY